MILVTGGAGFIGMHTVQALVDLGESCVLAQRRDFALPRTWAGRCVTERVDLADRAAFLALGRRHKITGIVHLAGSVPWPPSTHEPLAGARMALDTLFNVLEAAREWNVDRIGIASTIGVYGGAPGGSPYQEDVPLPMTAGHVIPAFKKVGEVLTDHLAGALDLDAYNIRIAAAWGPLGRAASVFFATPQLVHAAALGTPPPAPVHAADGADMCYVKDCGRAIALLQLAPRLNHRIYNVAGGRATTYAEVVEAIRGVAPEARIELSAGRSLDGPAEDVYLDITRLREDTGYEPAYDTGRAVADYIGWLRAGNER
ncbi:NAD(P)-dependent oxidoreductase [Micromonospora arborensis]|uniref:NAD-dependent epimerase/dehydratase family protein n=1 Tax=Micromonospora arborensis TaxID=2116518 RepID=UPI003408D000